MQTNRTRTGADQQGGGGYIWTPRWYLLNKFLKWSFYELSHLSAIFKPLCITLLFNLDQFRSISAQFWQLRSG